MAIVLASGRPAIDIDAASFADPDPPWDHLGTAPIRQRIETSIAAVGRLDVVGHPHVPFFGTAFAVAPNLVLASSFGMIADQDGDRWLLKPDQSLSVNFGAGFDGGDPVCVAVDDVVHVDPVSRLELLRVRLPASIVPLTLSTLPLDALADREIVVVGYPAADMRNEASLMQRLFRDVFNIKRLLPGRILGHQDEKGRDLILHDATTLGGCGGAPLIDLATGCVIGIHIGGRFLKENCAVPTVDLSLDPAFDAGGVEFATPATPLVRGRRRQQMLGRDESARAPAGIGTLVPGGAAAPAARDATIPAGPRPALPAARWQDAAADWLPLLAPHGQRIEAALRSVGRMVTDATAGPASGTAFLVGERLAMTASHCAKAFVEGSGRASRIADGFAPLVDFSDCLGHPSGTDTASVAGVRFIHPFFDVALLELASVPAGAAPINLAAQLPASLAGRPVAVLSFALADAGPGVDPYNPPRGLFVQPGRALQLGQLPDNSDSPGRPAVTHDCTTVAGAAGGPLVDLGTGYVIGIHTHGRAGGGFAQAMWELARDPNVWQAGIGFWPDPRPSWLGAWDSLEPRPETSIRPPVDPGRWTVDDIPIDWKMKEPRALEQLLIDSVEASIALLLAENVGLPLGLVDTRQPSNLLWREVIKKASVAGVLRPLLEEIAANRSYAGIAPKLREFI